MNKQETIKDYIERVDAVKSYINSHLFDDIDMSRLAEVSNFSLFHFHRIMRAFLGKPLWSHIIRLRLEAAAELLNNSKLPVTEIAYKVGYETPQSFTKAFKGYYNYTPAEFREKKIKPKTNENISINKNLNNMKAPKIKDLEPMKVIYINIVGEYGSKKMGETWDKLFTFFKEKNLFDFGMSVLGVSYDDPSITEPSKCRYDACVTIKKDVKPEGEIGVKMLEGGKYAIFSHKGPYDTLNDTYGEIMRTWLPKSKYKLRNAPCFEKYINTPYKTAPENLRTNIYMPVE